MGKFTKDNSPAWLTPAIASIARALETSEDDIFNIAVVPPKPEMGDIAVPMFAFAKAKKIAPPLIAKDVAPKIQGTSFVASAEGPYVNLRANRAGVLAQTMAEVKKQGAQFGHLVRDSEKSAVIDYSSPNIAKPLAFHHIRSTMIGNSIARILEADGYQVHGMNYLGDWGTQFGYMIAAHENDPPQKFDALTLDDFVKTYTEARARAKTDPKVDDAARNAFLRLEQGDASAKRVWKKARDASLTRFKEAYAKLGVKFEEQMYIGESFFEPMLKATIEEVRAKGLAKEDQGALIVDLEAHGIETPCLLRKSDGATLYATRDIASAKYRHATFGGEKKQWQALYVVDQGQSLHFKQVFKVLSLMGYEWASRCHHVPFGVLLMWNEEEQGWIKGKTRTGNVILLEDVLLEAEKRVRKIIDERNPELANKDDVARKIGVGAVVFNDLKNKRQNDVKFKMDDALSLEGETGPYIHNALVRTKSILRKAGRPVPEKADLSLLVHAREGELGMIFANLREAIQRAASDYDPSLIARYLLDLAGAFHAFHHDCLVLDDKNPALTDARLQLVWTTMTVLENAMALLGLESIEQM